MFIIMIRWELSTVFVIKYSSPQGTPPCLSVFHTLGGTHFQHFQPIAQADKAGIICQRRKGMQAPTTESLSCMN